MIRRSICTNRWQRISISPSTLLPPIEVLSSTWHDVTNSGTPSRTLLSRLADSDSHILQYVFQHKFSHLSHDDVSFTLESLTPRIVSLSAADRRVVVSALRATRHLVSLNPSPVFDTARSLHVGVLTSHADLISVHSRELASAVDMVRRHGLPSHSDSLLTTRPPLVAAAHQLLTTAATAAHHVVLTSCAPRSTRREVLSLASAAACAAVAAVGDAASVVGTVDDVVQVAAAAVVGATDGWVAASSVAALDATTIDMQRHLSIGTGGPAASPPLLGPAVDLPSPAVAPGGSGRDNNATAAVMAARHAMVPAPILAQPLAPRVTPSTLSRRVQRAASERLASRSAATHAIPATVMAGWLRWSAVGRAALAAPPSPPAADAATAADRVGVLVLSRPDSYLVVDDDAADARAFADGYAAAAAREVGALRAREGAAAVAALALFTPASLAGVSAVVDASAGVTLSQRPHSPAPPSGGAAVVLTKSLVSPPVAHVVTCASTDTSLGPVFRPPWSRRLDPWTTAAPDYATAAAVSAAAGAHSKGIAVAAVALRLLDMPLAAPPGPTLTGVAPSTDALRVGPTAPTPSPHTYFPRPLLLALRLSAWIGCRAPMPTALREALCPLQAAVPWDAPDESAVQATSHRAHHPPAPLSLWSRPTACGVSGGTARSPPRGAGRVPRMPRTTRRRAASPNRSPPPSLIRVSAASVASAATVALSVAFCAVDAVTAAAVWCGGAARVPALLDASTRQRVCEGAMHSAASADETVAAAALAITGGAPLGGAPLSIAPPIRSPQTAPLGEGPPVQLDRTAHPYGALAAAADGGPLPLLGGASGAAQGAYGAFDEGAPAQHAYAYGSLLGHSGDSTAAGTQGEALRHGLPVPYTLPDTPSAVVHPAASLPTVHGHSLALPAPPAGVPAQPHRGGGTLSPRAPLSHAAQTALVTRRLAAAAIVAAAARASQAANAAAGVRPPPVFAIGARGCLVHNASRPLAVFDLPRDVLRSSTSGSPCRVRIDASSWRPSAAAMGDALAPARRHAGSAPRDRSVSTVGADAMAATVALSLMALAAAHLAAAAAMAVGARVAVPLTRLWLETKGRHGAVVASPSLPGTLEANVADVSWTSTPRPLRDVALHVSRLNVPSHASVVTSVSRAASEALAMWVVAAAVLAPLSRATARDRSVKPARGDRLDLMLQLAMKGEGLGLPVASAVVTASALRLATAFPTASVERGESAHSAHSAVFTRALHRTGAIGAVADALCGERSAAGDGVEPATVRGCVAVMEGEPFVGARAGAALTRLGRSVSASSDSPSGQRLEIRELAAAAAAAACDSFLDRCLAAVGFRMAYRRCGGTLYRCIREPDPMHRRRHGLSSSLSDGWTVVVGYGYPVGPPTAPAHARAVANILALHGVPTVCLDTAELRRIVEMSGVWVGEGASSHVNAAAALTVGQQRARRLARRWVLIQMTAAAAVTTVVGPAGR